MPDSVCEACGHLIGEHFRSVDEKVRCLHSESGVSTSGVLGMPWTSKCDCVDYVSPHTARKREEQAREEREEKELRDKSYAELSKTIKDRLSKESKPVR